MAVLTLRVPLFILGLLIMGCAASKTPTAVQEPTLPVQDSVRVDPVPEAAKAKAPNSWNINKVEVKCRSGQCPPQVGALIFVEAIDAKQLILHRCTASLISTDEIISAGHCDFLAKAKGYFVSQTLKGKKEIREISGVHFKRYTENPSHSSLSSGKPDVAFFRLSQPIAEERIAPLSLAVGAAADFSQLVVYAVEQTPALFELWIARQECQVRRHEEDYPYDLAENPDMIRSYGCRLTPNNSGAPMFAAHSPEIQAIYSSSQRTPTVEILKREPLVYEKNISMLATNVRCLDLPSREVPACTVVHRETTLRRFEEYKNSTMLKDLAVSISGPKDVVHLASSSFHLNPIEDFRFERLHYPHCVNGEYKESTMPFVSEQIRFEFNEWAQITMKSLLRRDFRAQVKSTDGKTFELEVPWPAPAAEYIFPHLDLRKKWGSRFHIDIPQCPR